MTWSSRIKIEDLIKFGENKFEIYCIFYISPKSHEFHKTIIKISFKDFDSEIGNNIKPNWQLNRDWWK